MASEKTRCGGNWTEARFRGFITSNLRAASRRWPPKYETLKRACVGVKKNKRTGRQAKHYTCASCGKYFPQTGVQVDHIVPIGKVESWNTFIEKLFCESENLQVVCKPCHKKKTKKETDERKENSGNS